ncbi:MAG: hypothetical protein U1F43_35250 [Myxococcota bacterium]
MPDVGCIAWGLAALGVAGGCGDPAADASYPGEPLTELAGRLAVRSADGSGPDLAPWPDLRLAVLWGPGDDSAAPAGTTDAANDGARDDTPIVAADATTFTLAIYRAPPERSWRVLERGRLALGQIVAYGDLDGDGRLEPDEPLFGAARALVAFSPEGAAGALLGVPLDRGFHLLMPSAPCDVAALRLVEPSQLDVLHVDLDRAFDARHLFFDPACSDDLTAFDGVCPDPATVRWVCRYGPPAPALCGSCEYLLFPEGSGPGACGAWTEHCLDRDIFPPEVCLDEASVCRAGEPARAAPCDLACACDKAVAWCQSLGPLALACQRQRAACMWTERSPPTFVSGPTTPPTQPPPP